MATRDNENDYLKVSAVPMLDKDKLLKAYFASVHFSPHRPTLMKSWQKY
jgi:hypothetical protein